MIHFLKIFSSPVIPDLPGVLAPLELRSVLSVEADSDSEALLILKSLQYCQVDSFPFSWYVFHRVRTDRNCAHVPIGVLAGGSLLSIVWFNVFFLNFFYLFQLDKPRQDVLFCHMPGISLTQWLKNCIIKSTWRLKDQLNSKLSPGKIIKTYRLKDTMCFLEVTYSPSGFAWLERPISHIMSKLLPVVCF